MDVHIQEWHPLRIRNLLHLLWTAHKVLQNRSRSEKGVERMTRPIIKLPCTAAELESALHAVCDHEGLWRSEVRYDFYEKTICIRYSMTNRKD